MELFVIAILLAFADAQGSQLDGPQNTLSLVGSTITLKCTSPPRNCTELDWQKYNPGASPVTIFKGPGRMLNTNVTDRNRYSVDNSSGCDLVIKNVQLKDAGRFICSAIMNASQETKSAYLIILATQPKCTLNVSLDNTVEGDGVQLKCEVKYNGTDNASMIWKGVTDAPAAVKNRTTVTISRYDYDIVYVVENTISRNYSVVASAPDVPSFTCETVFAYETDGGGGTPIMGLATNKIPNATCSTSAINALYSVRDVTLSPLYSNYPPGNIITCNAKGNPSPNFKWQENENNGVWMEIRNHYSSIFTVTDVSFKKYRCVAMNIVRDKSYNATSDEFQVNNTDDLSTTAIGTSEDRLGFHAGVGIGIGIGVGIGFIVAILLGCIAFAMLVRHKYLELHPNPAADDVVRHQDHEMSSSSHQHSAVDRSNPRKGAPLVGEHESAYASLGEDRDDNEYASLEQRQKAKPTKKSRP